MFTWNRIRQGLTLWRILSVAFVVSIMFSLWNLVWFNFSSLPRPFLLVWLILSLVGLIISIVFLREDQPRFLDWLFVLAGCLYLVLLLDVTWFSRAWTPIWTSEEVREHYFETSVNLQPLHTIIQYLSGYRNGYFGTVTTAANLIGNVILLMPVAFFGPLFVKKLRKWYLLLPSVILLTFTIEGVQMLFTCGAFDMDDVILNVFGAMMAFLVLYLLKIWTRIEQVGVKKDRPEESAGSDQTIQPAKPSPEEKKLYVSWKKSTARKTEEEKKEKGKK